MRRSFFWLSLFVLSSVACSRFTPIGASISSNAGGGSGISKLLDGFPGITSALGTASGVRVSWERVLLEGAPDPTVRYRVYLEPGFTDPFDTKPVLELDAFAASATLDGIAPGAPYSCGIRAVDAQGLEDGNRAYTIAIPGAVRYVRAGSGAGGDGLSPNSAFSQISDGIASAAAVGGGSVWIAEGNYPAAVTLQGNVAVYGGFEATFDPALRDPSSFTTVIDGSAVAGALVRAASGASLVHLDGVTVDGVEQASFGVDLSGADACLANLTIRRCVAQGVRVNAIGSVGGDRLIVHRCSVREHFGEGLQLTGPVDALLTESEFARNFNEGLEAVDLSAPAGASARVTARRCVFRRNANEGADLKLAPIDLASPGSSAGARLEVLLERCLFVDNRLGGLKLDIDFTDADGIEAIALLDRCEARGNALEGIRLDLDARAATTVRDLRCAANLGAGLLLTGAASGAVAQICGLLAFSNGGAGVEIREGAVAASLVQCTLVNNLGGAAFGEASGGTIANSLLHGNVTSMPLVATANLADPAAALTRIPTLPARASVVIGGSVSFGGPHPYGLGDVIEISDDGIARSVIAVDATSITVDPPAAEFPLTLAAMVHRAPDEIVVEDATPLPRAGAVDAGIVGTTDSNGGPADLGSTGGSSSSLRFERPAIGQLLPVPPATAGAITATFSAELDAASVTASSVLLLDAAGATHAADRAVAGATLTVTPAVPLAGPTTLVISSVLRTSSGDTAAGPWVFVFIP